MEAISVRKKELVKQAINIKIMNSKIIRNKQSVENIVSRMVTLSSYETMNSTIRETLRRMDDEIQFMDDMANCLIDSGIEYQKIENMLHDHIKPKNDSWESNMNKTNEIPVVEEERINWDYLDAIMDQIDDFMNHLENHMEEVRACIADLSDAEGVVALGISGDISAGGYGNLNIQLVIDADGNMGLQFAPGIGVVPGVSADVSAYFGLYPFMKDISDLEGLGLEIGVDGGEGAVGSVAIQGTLEKPTGISLGLGMGGNVTGVDGHVAATYTLPTIPLGNVFTYKVDLITNIWNIVYGVWENGKKYREP